MKCTLKKYFEKKVEKEKTSLLIFSLTFSNHHEILNHNMADRLF